MYIVYVPQLHFSVDEDTAERLARDAAAHGMSLSKYIAALVVKEQGTTWPQGYLEAVVGSCAEVPLEAPPDLPLDDVEV